MKKIFRYWSKEALCCSSSQYCSTAWNGRNVQLSIISTVLLFSRKIQPLRRNTRRARWRSWTASWYFNWLMTAFHLINIYLCGLSLYLLSSFMEILALLQFHACILMNYRWWGNECERKPVRCVHKSAHFSCLASQDPVKKSPSRGFQETLPVKKDSELEVILRRRRKQACDPAAAGETKDKKHL